MRLNQFSHKRIVWNVINIISKLKEYYNFCFQARFSLIQVLEEKAQYNVYDSSNFFLKSTDRYSSTANSVLFLENSEIIIGEGITLVTDKRINKQNDEYYKRDIVPFPKEGNAQWCIVSSLATIKSEATKTVAELVANLFLAIKEYLNYCDLHLEYDEGLKTITIVE